MRALVTGGTGFVGSHLVRLLHERGHEARVLHRPTSKLNALEGVAFESALGDILDPASLLSACAGCDWVFHVAAVADYWRADKNRMIAANVDGTRNVLNAARAAGVKRVIFTSSAAAIGLRRDGLPADETVRFNYSAARFPYGYSKALAEVHVAEAVGAGQDVVTVNPVVVMGPGDLNLISGEFVLNIGRLGALTPVTSGGVAVTDVRDVARWHLAAAVQGETGGRYLLGTANYDYAHWFALIADVCGVGRPGFPIPDWTLQPLAYAIDGLKALGIPLPVDGNQTRLGAKRIFFDFSKTWAALGTPQYDMLTSLHDTVAYYRAVGQLS